MEASELRIGNFIIGTYENEDNNLVHETVCEFKFYNCYDNYYWVESEDLIEEFTGFKPIPLTEEWLLKFGFEFKEPILTSAWKNSAVGDVLITKCEFVHQLQNLFFALTGEELKLIH